MLLCVPINTQRVYVHACSSADLTCVFTFMRFYIYAYHAGRTHTLVSPRGPHAAAGHSSHGARTRVAGVCRVPESLMYATAVSVCTIYIRAMRFSHPTHLLTPTPWAGHELSAARRLRTQPIHGCVECETIHTVTVRDYTYELYIRTIHTNYTYDHKVQRNLPTGV